MTKSILLALILFSLSVASYAAPGDCGFQLSLLPPASLSDPPGWTITVQLPFPLKLLGTPKYFDGIFAGKLGGENKWTVTETLGANNDVKTTEDVPGDSLEKSLEKACPGQDIVGRIKQAVATARGAGEPAPSAGQASQFFLPVDLNGDAILDVIQVNPTGVTATLRNANGSARSSSVYAVAQNLGNIVASDFTGDGILDLVVSPFRPGLNGKVWLLPGNGGGIFQGAREIFSGTDPVGIVTTDFDSDGKGDLAVADASSVRILLGNGNGTFQSPVGYPTGPGAASLIAADFDGDGKSDIASLNLESNTVSVLRGNGNGTFRPAVNSPGGAAFATFGGYLTYTDLNHDGKLDLAVLYPSVNMIAVLLGKGDGSFQPSHDYAGPAGATSMAIIALQDGTSLLLARDHITYNMSLIIARGDGALSMPTLYSVGGETAAIAAGDINGDGKPDIVSVDRHGRVVLSANDGAGGFQGAAYYAIPTFPQGVAVGDLNGDGQLDVVTTNDNGTVGLLINANGTLRAQTTFAAGNSRQKPMLADFNSDGKLDVAVLQAVSSGNASVGVLGGNGDGTFKPFLLLFTGTQTATGMAIGDFDGDQKLDIAATGVDGSFLGPGKLAIFRGKGDGSFQDALSSVLTAPTALAAGDFNRDGKADLAVGRTSDGLGTILTLLSNGDGTFRNGPVAAIRNAGSDLKAVDLNRDGIPDLLNTACCGETDASYLLGNGDGSFQDEVHILSGPNPINAALADFNGDGRLDVAFGGTFGGYVMAEPLTFPDVFVTSAAAPLYRIAPASIASAFGPQLTNPQLNGTQVTVKDSAGVVRTSTLFFSSQRQINFAVPAGTALGDSTVTVKSSGGSSVSAVVQTNAVAPALFALNAVGLVAANVARVSGGKTTYETIYQIDPGGAIVAKAVDLGPSTDTVYLVLYGTGLRAAGTAGVSVSAAGITFPASYAGPQGEVEGFDQVNVQVPRTLAGKGNVSLTLTASGVVSNTVQVTFK